METQKLKGIIFVLFGAVSYGILATIVKYANTTGSHTSVLTFFQFFVGVIFLLCIYFFSKKDALPKPKSKAKLMLWGVALALTSTLYYLAIQFIPVSVGIVLLMQSIWLSLILEIFINRQFPSLIKCIGGVLAIAGTFIATELFSSELNLDWRGLVLGFGSGISYTLTIYASSTVEKQYQNFVRSLYFVMGGLAFICLFWNIQIIENMSWEAAGWGTILAIFGTVLPPLLFTAGIPKTGIGVGSILSSVEIPVSILSASLILSEQISWMQWFGVFIILISVVIVNLQSFKMNNDNVAK
ncbi:MAG TPA: DMT family transporter [Bacteroidia bacterium]